MAEEKPKKPVSKKDLKKVSILKNVKHNENRYKKGEVIEISLEDYEVLSKAGVILKDD